MTQVITMMRKCYLHIESLKGIVFAFAVVYNEYKREDHGPHGSPEETLHTIIS